MIEEIAHWVFKLSYNDLPSRIVEKAKLQILNIISAVLSGRFYEPLKNTKGLNLPDGNATVIPLMKKTSPEYAAFLNALYSMSFDFDDYLFMGHTGHSSVLVPVAIAEVHNLTINDIILAQVAANEVEGRLGASVLFGPHNGQMWSYIHSIGSAISASKLLGLSEKQIASAIALSFYQPNYPLAPGFMISDSKLITASLPILSGMLCTELAKIGMKGNTNILETRHGFLSKFSYLPLAHIISGFGEWWVTDTIAFKPYPGCAYIDTAIDSTYKILAQFKQKTGRHIEPDDVNRIDVFANILTMGMNALSEMYDDGSLNTVNINFSIPKSIAITLINHALYPEHLSCNVLSQHREKILSLTEKIRLYHDWYFTLKMQSSFFESIAGGSLLPGISTTKLINAFLKIRKDLQSAGLNMPGLLKAWVSLTEQEKRVIKNGLKRKGNYINMDRFTFSFGARVRLETTDKQLYEADSIIPSGASQFDQKDLVFNKLVHALGSEQHAQTLVTMLNDNVSVRNFIDHIH
ncbi:MAG: MmgE/PrpD family protein [bacterium]